MLKTTQLSMFDEPVSPSVEDKLVTVSDGPNLTADLGTFKDSLRAPIFGWFQYPAGYSFKLVYALFEQFGVRPAVDWVYDPFSGTGTTLLCAKLRGINGYGAEAHSFVHWVASVKLHWEYDYSSLHRETNDMLREARAFVLRSAMSLEVLKGKFPDLIYKCYHPQDLLELYWLREYVNALSDPPLQNLLKLALTDTLRHSAAAGTGWPYIAPNKNTGDKPPKQAIKVFERIVRKMVDDVHAIGRHQLPCDIQILAGYWTEGVSVTFQNESGVISVQVATDAEIYGTLQAPINRVLEAQGRAPFEFDATQIRRSLPRAWELANALIDLQERGELSTIAAQWFKFTREIEPDARTVTGHDALMETLNQLLMPYPPNPRISNFEITLTVETGNLINAHFAELEDVYAFIETYYKNPQAILGKITPKRKPSPADQKDH